MGSREDSWWKPDISRGNSTKEGRWTQRKRATHTSGLDPEVDLAFRGVCDAVATELHIRAAGGEREEGSETQATANLREVRGSGNPRSAGAQDISKMTKDFMGRIC